MITNDGGHFELYELVLPEEKGRFSEWLDGVDDVNIARISARLVRIEEGGLGDYKHVGLGIHELRLHFGSGYRIYFGREGKNILILLLGGNKSSQRQDIRKVAKIWERYRNAEKRTSLLKRLEF